MAKEVRASLSELLAPFKTARDAEQLLKTSSIEDFVRAFVSHSDHVTDAWCQRYARIVREWTSNPEVLGKPTVVLAKEVRADVFGTMDRILTGYTQDLMQLEKETEAFSYDLQSTSVVQAAMKGAAVGQLAGGLGTSGKALGGINALLAAGAEAQRTAGIMQHRAALLREPRFLALSKIALYLEQVASLPERLLDYGCARSLGGSVSFAEQQAAWELVQESVVDDLRIAVNFVLWFPEAEFRVQKETYAKAIASEEAKQRAVEFELKKRDPGVGAFFIACSIGLGVWVFRSCDLTTDSEMDMAGWLIVILVGFAALVFGILKFFDRTPKPPDPPIKLKL